MLGVTRERVRQIEARALRKLRLAILDDPELAPIVADMFGGGEAPKVVETPKHLAAYRPEGFFAPEKLPPPKALDVAAYLIDTLRVLGRATPSQIVAATELPMATVSTWLRELCDRGQVVIIFRGKHSRFMLVERGTP